MTLRETLKALAPPLFLRMVRRVLGRGLRFEGDYPTWADARKASVGYDAAEIAQRVYEAELKVKSGQAADARDGVVFNEIQYSLPVMAALARAAFARGAVLRVLDVGGALGRVYRQFKSFLPGAMVSWTVVEQECYVRLGTEHFRNGELRFASSLRDALAAESPDVVLLASVLQYLPDPYELIRTVAASRVPRVVIDRTPCSALERDVLTVQKVPRQIYPASYPCWIFSRQKLMQAFAPRYSALSSYSDGCGEWHVRASRVDLAGFLLERCA